MHQDLIHLLGGFSTALALSSLLYTTAGVCIGTLVSHLPGVGPSAGIALLIPVTFGMDPTLALMMLAGIYYGCMYGGAVTAILMNTPGDAAAVMTVLDGYPLTRQGRAGAALTIAATSSFMAGILSLSALVFVAGPLARFALHLGPPEYFSLMVCSLLIASSLSGASVAKGLMATMLGLMFATVGIDLQSGVPRFTFGSLDLQDGINFLPVVVGLFALSEGLRMAKDVKDGSHAVGKIQDRLWFTRQDWRAAWPAALRGTVVGFFCGAAPGLGGTVASMLSYTLEKKVSRTPERFGSGMIQGVAAPEAAVNADACGNFAHLLALGIPGSGPTAVLLGAFVMYGLQPGPMLFQSQPHLVWGLVASMFVGNVMLLILNYPLVGVLSRVLYVPKPILLTLIICIATAGVYSFHVTMDDLYLALGFAVLGYLFSALSFPKAPLLFGLILGSRIEQSFRQAMTISSGDLRIFVQTPLAAGLLGLAALIVVWSLLRQWRKKFQAPQPKSSRRSPPRIELRSRPDSRS